MPASLTVVMRPVATADRHPSDDEISLAVSSADADDTVIEHAAGCALCQRRLEALLREPA